jgi:cytochrome P450
VPLLGAGAPSLEPMETARPSGRAPLRYDPYDRHIQADPYPVYARLRAEDPVHHEPDLGVWTVSRFADVLRVAHDPRTFTSTKGITIGGSPESLLPMLIMMDPPHHDRLRSLVSRAFTPRAVAAMEPRVRELAAGLADELWAAGGGDLVADYTAVFPALVIAEMLGVDPADRSFFRAHADELVRHDPFTAEGAAKVMGAATALFEYLDGVVEARLAEPRDDLVTALTRAEIDGQCLDRGELLGFCFLLLVAGTETTTNLLGNAMVVLHRHPDQRARLEADRGLVPAAIEEVLRYESPVQGLARTTTEPVEVGGVALPADAQVLMLFGAANRDDAEFADADRFDVTREPERHLAFGHGVHFCLGAALARLEGRVGLDELLRRRTRLELVSDDVEWIASGPVRGPVRLPVEIVAP